RLRTGGYWTAATGKWHLGPFVKDRFDVLREGSGAKSQPDADTPTSRLKTESRPYNAVRSVGTQWLALLRGRPRDKPFFLWLAAFDPHRPFDEKAIPHPHRPEDVTVPPYLPDHPAVRKELALYYDEIARLDYFVGELLAELDRQGVADNTLVLFLSDNGR